MEEEYIIKLKDLIEMIPKEKWDGTKDIDTFRFIPLGQGIYREIIYDARNKPIDIKDYSVTFGLILSINNEKDPGSFFYLYQYKGNEYDWEWVRMVEGGLMYEVKALLKERKTWDAITTAVNTIIEPEALTEFKKIIKSIALGNIFYKYLEDYNIKVEELNAKEYFYRIYKYALKGTLDFNTYIRIVGIEYSDDWVVLDPNLIESIQLRIERVYREKANKN